MLCVCGVYVYVAATGTLLHIYFPSQKKLLHIYCPMRIMLLCPPTTKCYVVLPWETVQTRPAQFFICSHRYYSLQLAKSLDCSEVYLIKAISNTKK